MNALSLESMRRLAGVSAVAASLVAAAGSPFAVSAAYGAEVETCHSDCEDNVDDNTDDNTKCDSISAKGTDLAAKMAAVWGPLGGGAAKSGAPALRTGGMLKLRCAGHGPNGLPASFQVAGAYGPVRVHLTKIGPGATEAGRSGVAESKSDDDGVLGLYVPRGTPAWTVGLGRDAAGQFAGQLELRSAALYASTEPLTASSVELHRDTRTELDLFRRGGFRQVMAKECLAEIANSPTGGLFRVSFYLPAQVLDEPGTNGEYVVSAGAVPFAEYAVSTVTNGGVRAVRIVERRGGEVASELEVFREDDGGGAVFGVSEGGGLRTRRLRVLSESWGSRTVLDTVSGPGGVVVRETLCEYRGVGGREVLTLSVDDPSGEARTNRYEYTSGGYVSRHVAPNGLVTDYAYDSDNRRLSVVEHVPGGALPRRRRTYSYSPIGVRPHVPDSTGEDVADDTGDEDFFTPRVETEYVGDVAVSKTLRFVSTDTMNHRIVEEVRLADPSATNLAAEWNSPANARRYTDYMPYNRCRPCSERPALVVREDGVVEKYDYMSGTYGYPPGVAGSAQVFEPMAGGGWFRTVKTRYPAGALSVAGGVAVFAPEPFRTTREVTIEVRSSKKIVLRETYVCTGCEEADFARVSRTETSHNAQGREVRVVASDGSCTEKRWAGRRLVSETGPDGAATAYAYDALGRVISAVRSGGGFPDETTTTAYDAEGRVVSRTVSAGGLSRASARSYDLLGRLVSETAEDGVVTRRFYSNDRHSGTETVATVRGWGTDCAVTNSTVSYADGRLLSSALNGVVKSAVAYGADEDGTTWERTCLGPAGTNSPRWSLARTSPLGHEVETRSPGFGGADLVTSNFYNVAGQLLATQTFGGEDGHIISSRLYAYDNFGERVLDVTDLDLNGEVDWTSDRIVSNDVRYVASDGAWWRESTAWAARIDGSAGLSPVGGTRTRAIITWPWASVIGGLSLAAETVSADAFGNETTSRVWRVRSACAETRERTVPGSVLPERPELVRGREVSRRSSTGVETTTEYDALGRVVAVEDGRGNVTTT
ncbi:MAG: RHS repeat protein, partial [Kiritimatiellae bacterium]|nr:RHS repeat protein [Kiritimatiellia bacterium]